MVQAAITGTGEVPVEEDTERTLRSQAIAVAKEALEDSNLEATDVDAVLVAKPNGDPSFQSDLAYGWLVEELGLDNCTLNTSVFSGGATALNMLKYAEGLIALDDAETILCVHSDKASLIDDETWSTHRTQSGLHRQWETHTGLTWSIIPSLHATRYMHETGATPEQVASVLVANRKWAQQHPNAHFKAPLTVEEVLDSEPVASPYHQEHLNPRLDGATAFVVSSRDLAEDVVDRPAYVLGHASKVTHSSVAQPPSIFVGGRDRWNTVSQLALQEAGIALEDLGLANFYAATPAGNLEMLEAVGFCDFGTAGEFVTKMETAPGGSLPMSTNGGTRSYGHIGNGFGIALLIETANQIMGAAEDGHQIDDLRFGLQSGGGGVGMSAKIAILGNEIP